MMDDNMGNDFCRICYKEKGTETRKEIILNDGLLRRRLFVCDECFNRIKNAILKVTGEEYLVF